MNAYFCLQKNLSLHVCCLPWRSQLKKTMPTNHMSNQLTPPISDGWKQVSTVWKIYCLSQFGMLSATYSVASLKNGHVSAVAYKWNTTTGSKLTLSPLVLCITAKRTPITSYCELMLHAENNRCTVCYPNWLRLGLYNTHFHHQYPNSLH